MTGPGGWPMTVFLDAGRPTRSSAAPTSRSSRCAGRPSLPRAVPRHRRGVAHRSATSSSSRPPSSPSTSQRVVADGERPAPDRGRGRSPRRAPQLLGQHDATLGRLRSGAEVPADDEPRAAPARPSPQRLRRHRGARRRDPLARRHGRGRHLRPPRRRLRPLLGRRSAGSCPTSRRCSTTRRCWPARTSTRWQVTGDAALPPGPRRDHRLRAARPAPPDGGFYSAEDADSEGVEGKFYVWTPAELREALGLDADAGDGVVGRDRGRQLRGHHDPQPPRTAIPRTTNPSWSSDARRRLLEARDERVRPGLDDKVLTEWNALMLATLAEAARRHRRTGSGSTPRSPTASSCWPTCVATTDAGCGRGRPTTAGGPAPRRRRRPRRARRRLHPPGRGHRRGPVDRRGPGGRRRPDPAVLGRRWTAASSRPATTPSGSSPGPRTCSTTPRRRPTALAAVALVRLGRPHRRRRVPGAGRGRHRPAGPRGRGAPDRGRPAPHRRRPARRRADRGRRGRRRVPTS